MAMLRAFPLMLVAFLLYNAVVFLGGDTALAARILSVNLISGVTWVLSAGDLLLMLGLVLLYVEIFKATGTAVSSVVNHTLSMLVFIAFVVEFITVARAGTSVFFLLGLMSLMDVIAGFTVTIVSARRDLAVEKDAI
ncbi:MAG: hypothetical protein MUE39_06775 [Gammaproteobacteria bacterium]|jgi:hypothetical protein|nr:hypothetical protein [Gammaproteobacteria bacterium]